MDIDIVEDICVVITKHQPPLLASQFKDQIMVGNDGRRYDSVQDKKGRYYWRCVDKHYLMHAIHKYRLHVYDEKLPKKLSLVNEDVEVFVNLLSRDTSLNFSSFSRTWWMKKPATFLREVAFYHGWQDYELFPKPTKSNYVDFFMSYPACSYGRARQLFIKRYFVARENITNHFLSRLTCAQLVTLAIKFELDVFECSTKCCYLINGIQIGLDQRLAEL